MLLQFMEDTNLAPFMQDEMCNRTGALYNNQSWTQDCAANLTLPTLSDKVNGHITTMCTGVQGCIENDLIQRSLNSPLLLDPCSNRLSISIERARYNRTLSDFEYVLNKHKVKLQKNYMMFVHGVDSKTDIADHLYQSDVLSTEEKEEICNSSLTQQESNRLLYNKLIRKGGDAYTHLLEAVRHGKYQDVASEMEKTELSDQEIQLCQIGMKKLKDRHEKKDILMDHDEVIPKHILEQFEKRLEQWKKDDQQFITDNMGTEIEFVIRIPDNYTNSYIDRLLKDWENRFVSNVCQNRNMSSTIFTEKMVTRLNQLELSKQEELVHTKDIHNKDKALAGSCYMGTIDLVKWLIRRNSDINYCREDADVNKCRNDGTPPLQIACYYNMIEVVRELLQCDDVDIDLCDDDGCSSLYIASQEGHVDVVKELLQHSADVNKCDINGKNPLNVAQEQGHIEIESLLKGKGINQH
ncbi:ANKRD50 [Mytilus edulis]|uniref:ANKRD50 n=1 Tax=Mytilus edulis TaxID=6550 RepID=A0A8S3RVL8_MYTED|nr:ANKRD50 [Mytilus edulis]